MQDFLALSFIVFMFAPYAGFALVFITFGIRNWVWRPIFGKFRREQPKNSCSRIRSTSGEEFLS